MVEFEVCAECGVPRQFVENHLWLNNGIIVQSRDQKHRMVFIESENLDPLFKGIEEIIGLSIERIVIETKRRATREYIDKLIPDELKDMVSRKEMDMEFMINANNTVARLMGYGDVQLVGWRYEQDEEDYITQRITEPYSPPLWCGDMAGAVEAVTRRDNDVKYEVVSSDTIEITTFVSEHPPQFKGRLALREYPLREGDIELERCATCGGPKALSSASWDSVRGIITDDVTGRRMVMLGPAYLEAVFEELERELGEEIPRVVVEAQRRFAKSGFYKIREIESEDQFRYLLALRGMGNLRTLSLQGDRLHVRMENTALHLMFVGLMQGYFETATGRESAASWELSADGILDLEIAPL